jgi:hypothetical protein
MSDPDIPDNIKACQTGTDPNKDNCDKTVNAWCNTGQNLQKDICGCYRPLPDDAKQLADAYKNLIPSSCINVACMDGLAYQPQNVKNTKCPKLCASIINADPQNYGFVDMENVKITQYCGDGISVTSPPTTNNSNVTMGNKSNEDSKNNTTLYIVFGFMVFFIILFVYLKYKHT